MRFIYRAELDCSKITALAFGLIQVPRLQDLTEGLSEWMIQKINTFLYLGFKAKACENINDNIRITLQVDEELGPSIEEKTSGFMTSGKYQKAYEDMKFRLNERIKISQISSYDYTLPFFSSFSISERLRIVMDVDWTLLKEKNLILEVDGSSLFIYTLCSIFMLQTRLFMTQTSEAIYPLTFLDHELERNFIASIHRGLNGSLIISGNNNQGVYHEVEIRKRNGSDSSPYQLLSYYSISCRFDKLAAQVVYDPSQHQ